MKSGPRLSPFLHGQIVGMAKLGAKAKVIAEKARKKNKRRPSLQAVYILAKAKANPEWDGEEHVREGPGRPPSLPPALAQKDEEEERKEEESQRKEEGNYSVFAGLFQEAGKSSSSSGEKKKEEEDAQICNIEY